MQSDCFFSLNLLFCGVLVLLPSSLLKFPRDFMTLYLPSNFAGKDGVRAKVKIHFFYEPERGPERQEKTTETFFYPARLNQFFNKKKISANKTFRNVTVSASQLSNVFSSQPALFQPAEQVFSRAASSGTPEQSRVLVQRS